MTQHTPAPWKSSSHGMTNYSQEEVWGGNHGIAVVLSENPNLYADARLIAAAPELIELAKQIVLADEEGETVPSDIVNSARVLLTKAGIER